MWEIIYTSQAQRDSKKIAASRLQSKVLELLDIIKMDPFTFPPEYEILKGRMKGFVSRRINDQHRLVYQVYEKEKIIKILKMWTHYE